MKKQQSITLKNNWISLVVLLVGVVVWQVICTVGLVPGFMLPSPTDVVRALYTDRGLLFMHAQTTLVEAFLGTLIGVLMGFLLAVLMDAHPMIRKALYPILVITQTVPPVALAPLLILWFSYGIAPKVVLVVLVSFFPVAVGLAEGFASADPDMVNLMRSMGASRWNIFWNVKFAAAIPAFFSGLKIAVAYSVVGAVIAEWLGGFSGLGVYMTRVKKSFSYDKMFAVILVISLLSLILMGAVHLLQYYATPWTHCKDETKIGKEN